ncbi:hypothetical protein [Microvirga sp. BSC39]|uniref:hypothetical protein n=1 Tax=Microvirga sp. BSC39 TaxID=1549810 RepID=UPI0004E8F678|nr:hypothetical protein [Microvirga sp. BSC39]KFG67138.1 hypothetical protein JH26_23890 [Microvirga sp. BSC39]
MRITLSKADIEKYASTYAYEGDEELASLMIDARTRGFMTRNDLEAVARWKWRGGRTRQLVSENMDDEVREISQTAFSAKSERLRIGALLALRGVQWPMASVILHFAFPDQNPILDVRAMKTVGGSTLYIFEKWLAHTELCRQKAQAGNVTLRTLDRALWSADKAQNPKRRKAPLAHGDT